MIEIEQTNLQEGVEYFIEYSNNNSQNKRKLQGTFIKNTTPLYSEVITSNFSNVQEINCNKMSFVEIKMHLTQPMCNSYHWTFYQISEPIIYQQSINRLYENAINIKLRSITGDKYFMFM